MMFTGCEYCMYKGTEHGRFGSLALLDKIVEEGPMFNTPKCLAMFDAYLFGYLMGLGYKGVYDV